ncbi:unnamed protein product [Angiostrongylus costaricensis]|uniref:Fibronectin type-III domain-containing protein n=1 Tax=Angiostrongylus costaricensis TaxID=334426 RepID=A0A0R3PS86_ANGCS|nr:unnamed protein product [Angiostrongylus costaricensis]
MLTDPPLVAGGPTLKELGGENPNDGHNVDFTVRYRLGRENSTWEYARTSQAQLLINLPEFKHGEELFVQVKAEQNGEIADDWGQELIVTLNKKVSIGGVLIDDDELVPPLDFTTHILGPSSVKLEWRPHEGVPPGRVELIK